ncbi:MAG: hypothetical protein E7632_02230 [Ruminococcaceae bacterium]|nr:hypothetical protein [Oscillospiraceae bacterium]
MKKHLAIFLIAAQLAALTACGGAADTGTDTTGGDTASADTTEAVTTEDLSHLDPFKADYEGYNFRIITNNAESNTWYTTVYTVMEDQGDVLSGAIFKRNTMVEDALNIRITEEYQELGNIRNSLLADDDLADMLLINTYDTMTLAKEGSVLDLYTLPHQDFHADWWDSNAAKMLSIDNKLYLGAGDFITACNDATCVTYFNKRMIDDYQLEDPYELVKSGKWTLDKMMEMGLQTSVDNGDTIWNDQDTYGVLGHQNMLYIYMITGSGEMIITKDKDDIPAFTFNNEKFVNAYMKVLNFIHGNGEGLIYDANVKKNTMGLAHDHRAMDVMFPNNQALFWVETMASAKSTRNMEADFGIIPCPKYEESQTYYSNMSNGAFHGMMIPANVKDVDRTSFILEALNAFSGHTVQEAYYETYIKDKLTRDETAAEMLDLIFENRTFDLAICFNLLRMRHNICDKAYKNNTEIISYYDSMKTAMDNTINTLIESFNA